MPAALRGRSAQRLGAAAACTCAVGLLAGGALLACGTAAEQGGRPDQRACRLSADVLGVSADGLHARVPRRFTPARLPDGRGVLAIWVLDCRRLPLGGRPHRPGTLALVGAVVTDPAARPGDTAPTPRAYHHYLLHAHTDRPDVAARMRDAGLPVEIARDLRTVRNRDERVTRVAGARSAYVLRSPVQGAEDRPHDHRNVWWRSVPGGRSAALELRARDARDVFCTAQRCGTVSTPAAGPLARLLGARSRRAHASLGHAPLDPALVLRLPGASRERP